MAKADPSEIEAALKELDFHSRVMTPFNVRTDAPAHIDWKISVLGAIETIFGEQSQQARRFKRIIEEVEKGPLWGSNALIAERFLREAMSSGNERLTSIVENTSDVARVGVVEEKSEEEFCGRKVFIVHGHNEVFREKVTRLIEKLGLDPIILHEQPNQGRTIIEKFTEYAEVAFAIVLLTGDDVGAAMIEGSENLNRRARQNVVLELGYFLGKLGRARVCALLERGIEVPSDYSGVAFVELDTAGAWRLHLAKELRAAGLSVDLNAAL